MAKQYISLGKKAGIFYDPSVNLLVKKGQVVEVEESKLRSPKVKNALNGGHLIIVQGEVQKPQLSLDDLQSKFGDLLDAGTNPKKISSSFTLDQLKQLAESYNLEVEESDTKLSLVEAISEEIGSDGESEEESTEE